MYLSGEQFDLQAGDYAATVSTVGATLRQFQFGGRPLVRAFGVDEPAPGYSGAVLAPWPNRIGDGRYRYAGREHQLPINEPERRNALHGLVATMPWMARRCSVSEVELRCAVPSGDGYPFELKLEMTYSLDPDGGLTARLTARNTGTQTAPYGCSIHPCLVAGAGCVDDWSLRLPASRYLEVDPDRLLPLGERPVDGTAFDFRAARRLGDLRLDHALTGIAFDPSGHASATVLDGAGRGTRITWDRTCPWVQVHTADRPEPHLNRTGLPIEPMTCPPDAFRTDRDLVHLAPGQAHIATWMLTAVE